MPASCKCLVLRVHAQWVPAPVKHLRLVWDGPVDQRPGNTPCLQTSTDVHTPAVLNHEPPVPIDILPTLPVPALVWPTSFNPCPEPAFFLWRETPCLLVNPATRSVLRPFGIVWPPRAGFLCARFVIRLHGDIGIHGMSRVKPRFPLSPPALQIGVPAPGVLHRMPASANRAPPYVRHANRAVASSPQNGYRCMG